MFEESLGFMENTFPLSRVLDFTKFSSNNLLHSTRVHIMSKYNNSSHGFLCATKCEGGTVM
jgi:hypothetical protein